MDKTEERGISGSHLRVLEARSSNFKKGQSHIKQINNKNNSYIADMFLTTRCYNIDAFIIANKNLFKGREEIKLNLVLTIYAFLRDFFTGETNT